MSGDPAIRAEGIGKRYRLGATQRYKALRDTLADALRAPLRALARPFRGGGDGAAEAPEIWALRDVGFEVRAGEAIGVIGRNGAGKSTLLKILSRVVEPTTGSAEVRGRVGSLLEVGTGFHPELTGRENIYLNGAILGMRRREIDRKFDAIVAFAETERFLDTPVKQYSSGMYMRLAFAVAAHLEPEILLVDEVLAVGDAGFQKKCLGKMGEVAGEGRTVLFVSHNMVAIEQLCKKALLLEGGRVREFSSDVRGAIRSYLHASGDGLPAQEWRNPGEAFRNPWFRPLRFFLSDEAGRPLEMPASNATPMSVTIEGEIEELDPALTVGYAIYAEDGRPLYWSFQTDGPEDRWPRLARGRCVLRGLIPARLLNEGTYRVELIGSLHFRKWLFEPQVSAPSVHLTIRGGLSDSPLWMIKRPCLLAPVIPWSLVE